MPKTRQPASPPPGDVLATNIRRIREGQRLSYVALAEALEQAGRPIPVLGLRRIERKERRVDVDELLALAQVLGVAPVDLLVPAEIDDADPYAITPTLTATAGAAREWIGGVGLLGQPSAADVARASQWMPRARAVEFARRYIVPMSDEAVRQGNRRMIKGEGK